MTRDQIERDAINAGISPSLFSSLADAELSALVEMRRGRSDARPATYDGSDRELTDLMRHFDGAPEVLESYHRADPWLNGEAEALAAAKAAVFGGRR
jgi:hypothetical protein